MAMATETTTIDSKQYAKLLTKALPRVIKTEVQNEQHVAELERLASKPELTVEEYELMELLTLLVQRFEARYTLPSASPVTVILHLMEANGLKQKDLVPLFGAPSIVSEVLRGKRPLTLNHIKRLSHRFHVSPDVFLSDEHSKDAEPDYETTRA